MLDIKETIHARVVLSSRGFVLEDSVFPGDLLYDYNRNVWEEVKLVSHKRIKKLYEVHYSDGRMQYLADNEMVQIGDSYYYPHDLILNKVQRQKLNVHAIEFYDKVRTTLDPEPYLAGAFFTYGDYNNKYLNLPSRCKDAIDSICKQYHYTTEIDPTDSSRVVFKYDSILVDNYITWGKFFSKYNFFAKHYHIDDPPIPREYLYGSIEDRIHFVRGAFDAGYNMKDSPDSVAINHNNIEVLRWIQWILWSLGICSEITACSTETNFRLDIIGKHKYYPGFFYDNLFIRNMIDTDNRMCKTDPKEFLNILYLKEIKNPFRNELIPHFEFDNFTVLVDNLFLPKVSN